MTINNKERYLAMLSLLLVGIAGGIAYLGWQSERGQMFGITALLIGIIAVLFVPQPRQPQILSYRPTSWTQHALKWMSAPQIEAAILLWFGVALLAQPEASSIYRVSDATFLPFAIGVTFLLLAWRMAIRLPTPLAYSLMTGFRLLYTLIVVVDVAMNAGPWIVLGAYLGGIFHGVLAMFVQWMLRDMAKQVYDLQQTVTRLRQDAT
ncbi:MAG: hypothetical protein AAFR67_00030 [Chloroflexota bacterium]